MLRPSYILGKIIKIFICVKVAFSLLWRLAYFHFQDYIGKLAETLQSDESEDFILECVGILGNLTIPNLDYERLLTEYNLVDWIKSKLQPGQLKRIASKKKTECKQVVP